MMKTCICKRLDKETKDNYFHDSVENLFMYLMQVYKSESCTKIFMQNRYRDLVKGLFSMLFQCQCPHCYQAIVKGIPFFPKCCIPNVLVFAFIDLWVTYFLLSQMFVCLSPGGSSLQ